MEKEKEDCCNVCRYWKAENKTHGRCRRFPPIADNYPGTTDKPATTLATGWCGEFGRLVKPAE